MCVGFYVCVWLVIGIYPDLWVGICSFGNADLCGLLCSFPVREQCWFLFSVFSIISSYQTRNSGVQQNISQEKISRGYFSSHDLSFNFGWTLQIFLAISAVTVYIILNQTLCLLYYQHSIFLRYLYFVKFFSNKRINVSFLLKHLIIEISDILNGWRPLGASRKRQNFWILTQTSCPSLKKEKKNHQWWIWSLILQNEGNFFF